VGPYRIFLLQRFVELEALVGYAHRVCHPVVELAADPLPLGVDAHLQSVEPFALLLGQLPFCDVDGDPYYPRWCASLIPMNPALEVDPADVAGGPDDAKLQLVRRASSDGGVQRAAYTHAVVRVDPFEKALVRRVELARRVAEYLGYHVRAPALVGKHVPIQQTHTPCLGSQSEPLLGLLQLLFGPPAVDELADPTPDEADGVEQFFVRVQDLAA
jgi:hypothetical protein